MVNKLEWFRDDIMDAKIATARAEIDAGLTKKGRDIKAAYEAVKLSISKIDDHHFQYNVRSLLEDAKAEADRRAAHEEHDTGAIIDGIEQWVWDFTEESVRRVEEKVKAERAALADGLNAAADRVWEEAREHGDILAQHQAHEKTALEFFLKDCVKGLKHLFNRYGYVSPAFAAVEHQHGYGQPHDHVAANVDATKLVNTLGKNDDKHHTKPKEYAPTLPFHENESRSSCTGSSCDNPLEIDHDHSEIQLDSLEDLAHVIDDEIIHRTNDHEHVPAKQTKVREYEPFITQETVPSLSVDVAPVHAPTKEELAKPTAGWVMPERHHTAYEADEIPSFAAAPTYHRAEPVEEPHYVKPEPVHVHQAPAPVKFEPAPSNDIWGGYEAAWSKPRPATSYSNVTAAPAGGDAWKPATFQPFDVSKYLLRGRETSHTYGAKTTAAPWWEAQPAAAPKAELPWWEALTQDMPEDASSDAHYAKPATSPYKPARKAYVPRSTYTKPYAPAVTWAPAPVQEYWWQK